jgi:hypothetical protein
VIIISGEEKDVLEKSPEFRDLFSTAARDYWHSGCMEVLEQWRMQRHPQVSYDFAQKDTRLTYIDIMSYSEALEHRMKRYSFTSTRYYPSCNGSHEELETKKLKVVAKIFSSTTHAIQERREIAAQRGWDLLRKLVNNDTLFNRFMNYDANLVFHSEGSTLYVSRSCDIIYDDGFYKRRRGAGRTHTWCEADVLIGIIATFLRSIEDFEWRFKCGSLMIHKSFRHTKHL